jgi:hypothetical protein
MRTVVVTALLACTLVACGPAINQAEVADQRARLRAAMDEPVATRDERDAHSRLLAEVADKGALEGITYPELRKSFGAGLACVNPLCEQYGFGEGDVYYGIGQPTAEGVGQMPLLMIGLDPRGRVARVFTLTTH